MEPQHPSEDHVQDHRDAPASSGPASLQRRRRAVVTTWSDRMAIAIHARRLLAAAAPPAPADARGRAGDLDRPEQSR